MTYHRFLRERSDPPEFRAVAGQHERREGDLDKTKTETGEAGNRGPDVRSDCHVRLELKSGGGLDIDLESKVARLYGDRIDALCRSVLEFFGITDARLAIDDSGALPFVIAARVEAAVKKCLVVDKEFLPDPLLQNAAPTAKDRPRRSRLYLPGDAPRFYINAGLHAPDAVILDLEDSVALPKKDEARILVRNALRSVDFYGAERMVRINQIPRGLEDLEAVVPQGPNVILIPKCENPDDVLTVNEKIGLVKREHGLDHPFWLMPIIESPLGVLNAFSIASAADNIAALAIGLEDYTADLGTQRTPEGRETFFARSMVVNASRAAGVQPIDSVFSDIGDMEGLKSFVLDSKSLGFEGMGCIHPRQVKVIHDNYAPGAPEIEKARKIVEAFHAAEDKGLGVVSLGSKMIDPPVVKRALRTIALAVESGKLPANWRMRS